METDLIGIVFFETILLAGIALVSVHYRKKYEETKKALEVKQIVLNKNKEVKNEY